MATLEARSVVGLAGAETRGRRVETSGRRAETEGGRGEEDPMLREDDSNGSEEVQERILRITAIKNRCSLSFCLALSRTHTRPPFKQTGARPHAPRSELASCF